eukprot:IDg15047t1
MFNMTWARADQAHAVADVDIASSHRHHHAQCRVSHTTHRGRECKRERLPVQVSTQSARILVSLLVRTYQHDHTALVLHTAAVPMKYCISNHADSGRAGVIRFAHRHLAECNRDAH